MVHIQRRMEMKYGFLAVAISTLLVISSTPSADAQSRGGLMSGQGGFCPTGTCSPVGTHRASDVRNCKASNCPGAKPARTNKKKQ